MIYQIKLNLNYQNGINIIININLIILYLFINKMESLSDKFHKNPLVDPKTGNSIKISSKEYKKLVDQFGEVKIKSPKTGHKITVGKGEYNKLLKEGYNESDLLMINVKNYNFTGVKDVDLKILHLLSNKELYNTCQSNKYLYNICQDDIILKKKVKKIFKFIKFPMVSEIYYFVNRPNINIKKNGINFNEDKYDTLFKLNTVYCNVDGIVIYLTDYDNQYFTEKIIIDEPIQLTLRNMIQLIINEFNKFNMLDKFMKKYKKGAILTGMEYHNDGYYLMLGRYL